MKHVELTHNPYLNKTDITIDDNPILRVNSRIGGK